MSGMDLSDRLRARELGRIKQRRLEGGEPVMDAEDLMEAAVSNGGYETPELNDKLYLHFRGYRRIEGLEAYTELKALFLDSNGLAAIEGLSHLHALRCLYLQKNLIERVEGLEGLNSLMTLDLSENRIANLEGLSCLPALKTLNVSGNRLVTAASVAHLLECEALTTLSVTDNGLGGGEASDEAERVLEEVLFRLPAIVALNIKGNPVATARHFRKRMICECPQLQFIDRPVFEQERLGAEAWREGGAEAEVAARQAFVQREREEHSRSLHEFRDWQNRVRDQRIAEREARRAQCEADGVPFEEAPVCGVADRTPVQYATVSEAELSERERQRREQAQREAELERQSVAGEGVRLMGKAYWEQNGVQFNGEGVVLPSASDPESRFEELPDSDSDAGGDKENSSPAESDSRAVMPPPAPSTGVDPRSRSRSSEEDSRYAMPVEEDPRYAMPVEEDPRYAMPVEEDSRYAMPVEEVEDPRYAMPVEEVEDPRYAMPVEEVEVAEEVEVEDPRYAMYQVPVEEEDEEEEEDEDTRLRRQAEAEEEAEEEARQARVQDSLAIYREQKRRAKEAAAAPVSQEPEIIWTAGMDARLFHLVQQSVFDFGASAETLKGHSSVVPSQRELLTGEKCRLRYVALDAAGYQPPAAAEDDAEDDAATVNAAAAAIAALTGIRPGTLIEEREPEPELPEELRVPYGEGEAPPTIDEMLAPYRSGTEPAQRKTFEQLMREGRPMGGVQIDLSALPSLAGDGDSDDDGESKGAEEPAGGASEEEDDGEEVRPLTRAQLELEIFGAAMTTDVDELD